MQTYNVTKLQNKMQTVKVSILSQQSFGYDTSILSCSKGVITLVSMKPPLKIVCDEY